MVNLASFWQSKACGQTELPGRSVLIGQKLVENAKIKKKLNATVWVLFKQCEYIVKSPIISYVTKACFEWIRYCTILVIMSFLTSLGDLFP